jgi:hypothetical protein
MSRAYDAKQAALKAHPNDEEAAVDLFIGYLGCSESDFIYEENMSPRDYIFGKDEAKNA